MDKSIQLRWLQMPRKNYAVVPVLVGHKKGITIEAETVNDKEIICACTKIHELNPVSGYYNIQLIKEDGGRETI